MADYVDNKKFTEELGIWAECVRKQIDNGETPDKMTDYIGKCVYLICTNMRYSRFFVSYSQNDTMITEMIGLAFLNCIKYAKNFDRNISNNAFGYINRIAYFAFISHINREKKRYMNNLSYIRKTFLEDDIREALDADNPNDIKNYTTYVNQMVSILDDMCVEIPEIPKKVKKYKKKGLDDILTGEKY